MLPERIALHHISQPYVHPFRTSFGEETGRHSILIEVESGGIVGWGECVAEENPFYSGETVETAWHMLTDYLAPAVLGKTVTSAKEIPALIRFVRGNPMAKGGLENAFWALEAKQAGKPLSALLGGVKERVEVGVSIGIQPDLDKLMARVDRFVEEGYGRIKIKIEPGWDVEPVRRLREKYPDLKLMADANSAFTLNDIEMLKRLDGFGLLMIEQPLSHEDVADHARLQAELNTPICLDESIKSPADAQAAIDLKACGVFNIKVGRVGGLTNAVQIHDMAAEAGIDVWCGGMLETGIGRATNTHLASLPNFTLPGDISATDRYYRRDIATPPFVLNRDDSTMTVPTAAGLGVEVDREHLEACRLRMWEATLE